MIGMSTQNLNVTVELSNLARTFLIHVDIVLSWLLTKAERFA